METTVIFDQKVALTPKELNQIGERTVDELLIEKTREKLEGICITDGFVLPGKVKLISRSMGQYEAGRFTGDAIYYAKLEVGILYPTEGVHIVGNVIRKNKMGLYVVHRDAIRVQIIRDLHIGNEEFEKINIGDSVEVELKKSRFQVNDTFILASGVFVKLNREVEQKIGASVELSENITDHPNMSLAESVLPVR